MSSRTPTTTDAREQRAVGRSASAAPGDVERALLAAIHERPETDEPRLVYADWLMQQGDPHGQFIALQCAHAGQDEVAAKVVRQTRQLLDAHARGWFAPLAGGARVDIEIIRGGARLRFRGEDQAGLWMRLERGFLAEPLCVSREQLQGHDGQLFRLSPTLYEIARDVHTGRVATVAEARIHGAGGPGGRVAIKRSRWSPRLGTGLGDDSRLLDRKACGTIFGQELSIGRIAAHPNLAQYLGQAYWASAGDGALAMEWVDGLDGVRLLDDARQRGGPVPPALATAIAIAICRALVQVHLAQSRVGRRVAIVHGEVCPKHVMIGWDGDVKLLDLGWSWLHANSFPDADRTINLLTPRGGEQRHDDLLNNLPRELLVDGDGDQRSDQFSLGMLLYELLTNRHPFRVQGASAMELIAAIHHGEFAPVDQIADVPRSLARVLARALAANRSERYRDVQTMQQDLEAVVVEQGWRIEPEFVARMLASLWPRS